MISSTTTTPNELRLEEGTTTTGNHYTSFKAGDQAANISYTLPTAAPTANGQILTATTAGIMTWATAASGADNLGNHTATQNLSIANFKLVGNAGSTGVAIESNGNTGIGTTTTVDNRFKVSSANIGSGTSDWVAANFGASDASGATRVVMGNLSSVATIGGHNNAINAWANLAINPGPANVSIGMGTPTEKLHVFGNILTSGTVTASCGTLVCSDIRYKRDITPLTNSLSKVMELRGVNYLFRQKDFPENNFNDRLQIGFIAQELETVYPELVNTDSKGFKSVDYAKMTPVLVQSIQELEAEIQRLKKENGDLKTENASQSNQLQQVSSRLDTIEEMLRMTAKK